MKYLKSYKVFESNWHDIKDHLDVLSNMSLDLWDKDFNVQVADEIISREHQCVVVNIIKKGDKRFTYPEIKEELLQMVDYMDRNGWEILNMEFMHIVSGYLYCKLDVDRLVNMSGEEITYEFNQLIVKFVEKGEVKTNESTEEDVHREMMKKKYGSDELEESDSLIKDIESVLFELNDLEIFTEIKYSPLTTLSIDQTPKITIKIKCDSILWNKNQKEINNAIDTIKGIVSSYKYSQGSTNRASSSEIPETDEFRVGLTDRYNIEFNMIIQK
jgi:hypothetical protein